MCGAILFSIIYINLYKMGKDITFKCINKIAIYLTQIMAFKVMTYVVVRVFLRRRNPSVLRISSVFYAFIQ